MRTVFLLLAAVAGAALLAIVTIDSWLPIGERAQGGYEPLAIGGKTMAEERARKAITAAQEAVREVEALAKDDDGAWRERP